METLKILIADSQEEFRDALADALTGVGQLRTTDDGLQALQLVQSFDPDILVLDTMLPGMDGMTLSERIQELGFRPGILAITRHNSPFFLQSCEDLPIDYIMMKPCALDAAVSRILCMAQVVRPRSFSLPEPKTRLSSMLLDLDISPARDGSKFVKESILQILEDPDQKVTKHIYPAVAKHHNTTVNCVEHSIRDLLHKSWQRRNDAMWRSYFPTPADKTVPRPTNDSFIRHMAELLALRCPKGK